MLQPHNSHLFNYWASHFPSPVFSLIICIRCFVCTQPVHLFTDSTLIPHFVRSPSVRRTFLSQSWKNFLRPWSPTLTCSTWALPLPVAMTPLHMWVLVFTLTYLLPTSFITCYPRYLLIPNKQINKKACMLANISASLTDKNGQRWAYSPMTSYIACLVQHGLVNFLSHFSVSPGDSWYA